MKFFTHFIVFDPENFFLFNFNIIIIILLSAFYRYTVEYFSSDLQTGWVVAAHRYAGHTITVRSIYDLQLENILLNKNE